jgi:hypothetical protein
MSVLVALPMKDAEACAAALKLQLPPGHVACVLTGF